MKQNGYEEEAKGRVITIFSAPNYCDQMGNKGAFIRFNGDDMKPKFTTFTAVVKTFCFLSHIVFRNTPRFPLWLMLEVITHGCKIASQFQQKLALLVQ